jgi:site-specific recombinase XerD
MGLKALDDEKEFLGNFTSTHTRASYARDLSAFAEFLSDAFADVAEWRDIERKHIISYRNWLVEAGGKDGGGHAPKTISRKLASLSSYFHFLVEKSYCEFNPVTSIKRPRGEVKSPTNALTADQVRALFAFIDQRESDSRLLHRALLTTFFMTGLRKSEVIYLKFKNYRDINGHKVLEFVGKGGKIGQKVLADECIARIEEYLAHMKKLGRKHLPQDWLFQPTKNPNDPTRINKPLNPKTINEILNFYAKKMGFTFNICPHSARATFISNLLDNGIDIYSIAREVNHSSVTTTQEYDKRRKKLNDSPVQKLSY